MRTRPPRTPSVRAVIAALLLAACGALAQGLGGPLPALACSCAAPLPSMARVAAEPNTVIVVGTIGRQLADRTPVAVDTWFHGPGASEVIWLGFGSQAMSSCDPFVTAGERRLLVLFRQEGMGTFGFSPCVASGVIGTEAGDEALAEATELFGAGPSPPPGPTEPPVSPRPPPGDPGAGWLFVVGALGAAALIFAVVALLGLRRRQPR
jgi:hypothetical protein